jgi:signal transduction histidine kinase
VLEHIDMSDRTVLWSNLVPLAWVVLAVGAIGVTKQVEQEKLATFDYARAEQVQKVHQESRRVAGRIEVYVDQIYRGLRTIARLPGIRTIDRHGTNFGDARIGAQEIYNNLAETVRVSEVYVLPIDFDPDAVDPVTGKLQEPIVTFDELIVGRTAEVARDVDVEAKKSAAKVEEIEIYEYRLMQRQIKEFVSKYPIESSFSGLSYPALLGPEVITCDNTNFSETMPNDEDRKGLVYSVPFYRPDGRLAGIISAVVLTLTIRDQLPPGAYQISNAVHEVSIANGADQGTPTLSSLRSGGSTAYSDIHELSLRDITGAWKLRNGFTEADFWRHPDVVASKDRAFLRHAANAIAFVAMSGLLALFLIRQSDTDRRNTILEGRIVERTRDLETARKEADNANLAKSRFLATMSHEIRTPMSAMLGTVEHLSRGELNVQQQRHLSVINESGQALLGLINEILDWSAVEAGRVSLSPEPYNIRLLIDDCVRLFEIKLREKGVALTVDVEAPVPECIWVDRGRFRQVLVNILANAAKFTERGEISVCAMVATDQNSGVEKLRIEVADTGPGVGNDVVATIFELPSGTTRKAVSRDAGAGLGLVISRELVEIMGGRIGLSNRTDIATGASFFFELPLRAAQAGSRAVPIHLDGVAASASPLADFPELAGCRVLLVEDNPALAALTEDVLRNVGCHVDIVGDGEVAISTVLSTLEADGASRFDIILMDCRLPGVDGITAAAAIRKIEGRHASPKLPIIALTANAFDWDRDACIAAGMTDFLSKPFTGPQLIDVLIRALADRPQSE